jgi:hypothetical protein
VTAATFACEALAFRLTDLHTDVDPRARRVEDILRDRHDQQDHATAVRRLQHVRPTADRRDVESFITALVWYAQEVQFAWPGPVEVFERRVYDYETCLLAFAHGGQQ